jgi:hypothetical protein
MSFITVPSGSGGASVALAFATKTSASLASALLSSVYAAAASGTLVSYPSPANAAAVSEYVILPTETGSFTVPAGYNVVVDASYGNVTIVGNGSPNESIVGGSGNIDFVSNGGSGTIVSGGWTDTFSGAGSYALLGDAYYESNVPPTSPVIQPIYTPAPIVVVPVSPVDIVDPVVPAPISIIDITITTIGAFNYGTGSGLYDIVNNSDGPSSINIDAGASTVSALVNGGIYYHNGGSLTFLNNGASTVIGSATSGPATIFGGNSNGAYIQGADPAGWMFVNGSSNSTITAGLAGGVLAFNGAGGTVNLLGTSNSAFNYLVGGTGAETLNAAFATGTAVVIAGAASKATAYLSDATADAFFAGAGSATVMGGASTTTLPDLYAFAEGSAGGTDLILNWGQNSGLVFLGYGAAQDALISAELAATPTNSAVASLKLPDNTIVTIVGMNGAAVNLHNTPTFLS